MKIPDRIYKDLMMLLLAMSTVVVVGIAGIIMLITWVIP